MPIERLKKKVLKEVDVYTRAICNKCEREWDCDEEDYLPAQVNLFKASGSYSSDFPGDLQYLEFVLCGPCLKQLVCSFKIIPRVNGYGYDYDLTPSGDILILEDVDIASAKREYEDNDL
jgi:hypothetical protein